MKAFRFRLDRVLDWREIERRLAATRVEAAEAALAKARIERDMIRDALHRGPEAGPTGATLANWGGWRVTLTRHLHASEQRISSAQSSLQQQQTVLVEANRRVKLLVNLRTAEFGAWQRDLDREMSSFATDLHLSRIYRSRK